MPDEKIKIFFPDPKPRRSLNTLGLLLLDEGRGLRTEVWRYFNAYDRLIADGPRHWEAATLDEADVVVDPHWLHDVPGEQARVDRISNLAVEWRKPCLFFQNSDFQLPCVLRSGKVYRTSIFESQRTSNEEAMPGENDDMLLEEQGVVPLRPWTDTPIVSFCGNLGNPWNELVLKLSGKHSNVIGTRLRRKTIRYLRRCQSIRTSIIARSRYWGGTLRTYFGKNRRDVGRQQKLRQEYKQNMLESDYVLCLRGAGNYSFRFYETLSAGRIPLLIDTDCSLPFAQEIDWSRHCCIVPENQIAQAGELLQQFHQRRSPEEYQTLQAENRRLWASYCEVFAFYRRVLSTAANRAAPPMTAINASLKDQ